MIPQMSPYTPELYQPDSYGRYRKYPRFTKTPIPGAGYKVGELVWAEQELNLNGGPPQTYGNYSQVPLRGLGAESAGLRMNIPRAPSKIAARARPAATAQTSLAPPRTPPGLRRQAAPSPLPRAPMLRKPAMAPRFKPSTRSQARTSLAPSRTETMVDDMDAIAQTSPADYYSMTQSESAVTSLSPSGGETMARRGHSETLFDPYDDSPGHTQSDADEPLRRRDASPSDLGAVSQMAPLKRSIAVPGLSMQAQTTISPSPNGGGGGSPSESPQDYMGWNVEEEIRRAAEAAASPSQSPQEAAPEPSFFMRKAGPVPYWAIGLGGAAIIGGGIFWYVRSR